MAGTHLPTPEGWKAKLTALSGEIKHTTLPATVQQHLSLPLTDDWDCVTSRDQSDT